MTDLGKIDQVSTPGAAAVNVLNWTKNPVTSSVLSLFGKVSLHPGVLQTQILRALQLLTFALVQILNLASNRERRSLFS